MDASYIEKFPTLSAQPDAAKGESKKTYPSTSLNKEVWEKLKLSDSLAPGDKIKAEVTFVVTRVEKSNEESFYRTSLGLELQDIEPEEQEDKDSSEKKKEEKMLGYKRESSEDKSKIKPPSGKDLEKY